MAAPTTTKKKEKQLKCPSWLAKDAKAQWRRILPLVERAGVLEQVDEAALATLCQLLARWKQAEDELTENGLTWRATCEACRGVGEFRKEQVAYHKEPDSEGNPIVEVIATPCETCRGEGLVGPPKLNPAARYADSLVKQIKGLLVQFGFTPASRGRAKGMSASGGGDEFDRFLSGAEVA